MTGVLPTAGQEQLLPTGPWHVGPAGAAECVLMRRQLLSTTVMTDYGQFDLTWGEGIGFEGDCGPFFTDQVNGLVGAGPEGVYINLARRSGGSSVTIALHDTEPDPRTDFWEDVVEVSTSVPRDEIVRWQSWAGESSGELAVPAGDHRVRVSARGRDAARDNELAEGTVDFYEIDLWPAPVSPDAILRIGSEDAAYWHRTNGGRR